MKNTSYTFYDSVGAIQGSMTMPPDSIEMNREANFPGLAAIEGKYSNDTHWIQNGLPVLRVTIPFSLTGNLLKDYPEGTMLYFEGGEFVLEDSTTELDFDVPGVYVITLAHAHPQYLDTPIEVVIL